MRTALPSDRPSPGRTVARTPTPRRSSGSPAPRETYELTGQPLDGRYLLPMFAWMQRHDPARASRGRRSCSSAKDYLFFWLTGELLTDPSTATGYGCYELATGAWLPHLARPSPA